MNLQGNLIVFPFKTNGISKKNEAIMEYGQKKILSDFSNFSTKLVFENGRHYDI